MRLYHGSNVRIGTIDLTRCHRYKDFGTGFYLTPDYRRAVLMAQRTTLISGTGSPTVSPYIFNLSAARAALSVRQFGEYDSDWALFVMRNRDRTQNPPYGHRYDIVIGPVADSQVDAVIEEHRREYGAAYADPDNLAILAGRLKYSGPRYIQYCFCTRKGLSHLVAD